MRGTPLLLQLFFIFYGLPYVPVLGRALAFKSRFLASCVAFILNYAAYLAEIFRGGFLAIDGGQLEAAKVLGLSQKSMNFKILLPQVLRVSLPAICNESVSLVKDTALVFSIGVCELLASTKNVVNATANVSFYVIAAAIYFLICSLVVRVFQTLEKKLDF
jgi:polar amino acid transport system permease protein